MWCLWNGEYGEHDVQDFSEKHLQYMDECHAKWAGHIVGDFTCIKVEYDWGKRDQRWTIKCNLCGAVSYRYHAKEWRRRTNARCGCRKAEAKERKEQEEKAKKERAEERKAKAEAKKIEKLKKEPVVSKYASDEWIGKRNGHLTVIGRDGSMFVCRCDCGNEITVKPTFLFTYKNRKDCGMPDCPYSTSLERASRKRRSDGFAFERRIEQELIAKGYDAVKTQDQADFGVDIIIKKEDGSKTAIQCKKQETPAGIEAVQEVYAGGRFYDCTKFAVICEQGFSNPAILMARKLGVYLCDGEFEMPTDIEEYTSALLPVFHGNDGLQKLYDINGTKHTLSDWCIIYGKPQHQVERLIKRGCTAETALRYAKASEYKQLTVRGVTGNFTQVCNYFDVLPQTVKYRIEHMGMTLEEAIFTPTKSKTAS